MKHVAFLLGRAGLVAVAMSLLFGYGGCLWPGTDTSTDTTDDGSTAQPLPLQPPLRIAPLAAKGVLETQVGLAWGGVPGATLYSVYFGPDTNPPLIATTTETSYPVYELAVCTMYYWRIVASNDQQAVSSTTFQFETRCPDEE
jgi:hypothetical protein